MLNLSRRSYREKFVKELEYQIDIFQVENNIDTVKHRLTYEDIERIDRNITSILQKATKKVEGMRRNIPFSHEKEA